MTDSFVQWLTAALGGKVSGEIIIFLISMVPILELRGGLLAASPALLNVPILRAIPICIIGNILPIPFILLLIEKVLDLMERIPGLKKIALWIRARPISIRVRWKNMGSGGWCSLSGSLCREPEPGQGRWLPHCSI